MFWYTKQVHPKTEIIFRERTFCVFSSPCTNVDLSLIPCWVPPGVYGNLSALLSSPLVQYPPWSIDAANSCVQVVTTVLEHLSTDPNILPQTHSYLLQTLSRTKGSPCRIPSKFRVSIARAAVRSGGENDRDGMVLPLCLASLPCLALTVSNVRSRKAAP